MFWPPAVPLAQRRQAICEFPVTPHPAGKVHERVALSPWLAGPYIPVQFSGIGPVSFNGDNPETVLGNKSLGDGGTGAIEFRGPVRGLAQKDNPRIGETVCRFGQRVIGVCFGQVERFGADQMR